MTDPFRTSLRALAALLAVGCSTAVEPEAAPPTAPVIAAEPAAADPGGPCVADEDCLRTDCCGVGDGCAPAPRGQACGDAVCPKSVWSRCRCEASRCAGVFWDPTSDTPRPAAFADW